MSISDDIKYQINDILRELDTKRKEALSKEYVSLGEINYNEYGSDEPSFAKVWTQNEPKSNTIAYFQTNDPKNKKDNHVVINVGNNLVRTGLMFPSMVKAATGISVYDAIKDVLYHEMIHAIDPTQNTYRRKNWGKRYDINNPSSYYADLGEFKAFTGQFQEKIVDIVKSSLRNSGRTPQTPSDIENFLQSLLDYFSGKIEEVPTPIKQFLHDMGKEGIIKKMVKKANMLASLVGFKTGLDFDDPTAQFIYIKLIKKYNPTEYKRFLKNIYLTIKECEKMVNEWIKSYSGYSKTYDPISVGGR
jgi:hypothetical protein